MRRMWVLYYIWKSLMFGQEEDDLGKVKEGKRRKVGIASSSTMTEIFHTYCTLKAWVKGAVYGVHIECIAVAGPCGPSSWP